MRRQEWIGYDDDPRAVYPHVRTPGSGPDSSFDSPWSETIDRWCAEGMPTRDYVSYFNLDKVATISVDNSPRYEEKVLEETDEYRIYTTFWGATQKSWKKHGSTPEFLDFKIKDAEKWLDAKRRMIFDESRIP